MEADWEVEIGPDAPLIDPAWLGFVDLRGHPEAVWRLAETAEFPALARALVRLNRHDSPVWTAKCDLWPVLDPAEFDADEMEASPGAAEKAWACYIDLLAAPGSPMAGSTYPDQSLDRRVDCYVEWCKRIVSRLRARPLSGCRIDLAIRRASTGAGADQCGVTAYVTACGATSEQARLVLASALTTLADALVSPETVGKMAIDAP